MHHGGVFKGYRTRVYIGGTVTYFDFCDIDEISYMELVNMASEMGEFTSIEFYGILNGTMKLIKGDSDTTDLCLTVDKHRVVECYMVSKLVECYGTQESQRGKEIRGTKSTRSTTHNLKGYKGKYGVNVEASGDDDNDTDDYDLDSSSSSFDESEIYDSDYELTDDDALFFANVDKDTTSGVTKDYADVVDLLADIDGDTDVMTSDDDLRSIDSDSDEEGRGNRVKHTVFNEKTDMDNPIFKVGMEFKTHGQFREAVKEHAIKWGKEIKFLKSDKRQVRATWKSPCPWTIYCSYVPNDEVYRVKTFIDEHSCVRSFKVPWVSTKWIVKKYSERIRKNPTWPIPSLVDTIQSEKTVQVNPQKAYRAKKISLDMLQGSAAKQFTMLNSYAKEILNTNDGTTVIIKVKPVVGSEGEVKFKRFTFMSDKQKGLIDSVSTLFPNASHRFCVRHLYNNFKGEFKGLVMKDILWKAARATIIPHFTAAMEEMKAVNKKAYEWLCERPPVNWSRSHFDTFPKCDILLNNLCESYNSAILSARDQPIITMLERIRVILMETIYKRRDAMKRAKHPICPKIVKRIEKLKDNLQLWIPRWCGSEQFEVTGPTGNQYRVDLVNRTCGCRKWDMSGIPCVHALASIKFLQQDPFDYVHEWYKVSTYLKCYENLLSPINGRDLWPETNNPVMLPPDVKKRSGRPKKARRREPEEPQDPTKLTKKGVQMRCSACGKVGHNKRGCKKTKPQGEGPPRKKSHVDASTSAANVPSVSDPAANVPNVPSVLDPAANVPNVPSVSDPVANVPSIADPVAPTNGNTTMVRSPAPHQPPMASQESMASSALTMVNRTTLASSGKMVWRGRVVRLASSYKKTPK
ncbi:hypothetical protein Vadar_003544 [Vaccinium darrowii]|uniref:Uncharacterized protein n=1 Tax=Vaccinium darrowii TaxID=229202 RepID=A0ACB7Z9F5_9ERIC|nr:hypothetical protein Vadar_003544 [Vaccinium darrowii]